MKTLALLICLLAGSAWAQEAAKLPLQFGHTGDVAQVKWSPDEKAVLSYSSQDGMLLLWDVGTGKLLWNAPSNGTERLTCWAWSGALLATGYDNGSVRLWEATTGTQRWEKAAVHSGPVSALAFSPDTKQLASAGVAEKGGEPVKVWNTEDGAALREIKDSGAALVALAWDKALRGGRADGVTAHLETAAAPTFKPCGDKLTPETVGFSRDLSLVAAACGPDKIVVADNARQLREWKAEEEPGRTFSFSGDGKWLVAVSLARTVFYPLGTGDARVVPEDQRLGEEAELNRDGSRFVEGGGWGGPRLRVGDATNGQTIQLFEAHPGVVNALAFSPDGSKLATGSADHIVRLWNAQTGAVLAAWAGHKDAVKSVAWSPDGKMLVSLGADRTVRLWDVAQGKEVRSFDLAQSEGETAARSAAFSPDGKTLLVAGVEAVELWSGEQWETRATLRAEPAPDAATCGLGEVYSARFSADGQQIVTGCGDKSVKIWTAKDGKLVRSFEVSGDEPGVVFSPDGKTIAVSLLDDTPVTLYETATGKTLRGLDKETSLAYDLSFSPDGKSLIASTLGGDIILCNVADGTVLRKLSSGLSSNDVVAFSPNGKLIATGGTNQNVLVWETASGKLLWKALRQAGE